MKLTSHPLTAALSLVSPSGSKARLSVLIYHRVLPDRDPLLRDTPDSKVFEWQMALIARHFNVLSLEEAGRRLQEGTLPARAASITFDDGYADNLTVAWPILQKMGLPTTFFVASGYLDGGRMFNDTIIELVRRLPMGHCELGLPGLEDVAIADIESRNALVQQLIGHFKYQPLDERNRAVEGLAAKFDVELPNDLMMTTEQLRKLDNFEGAEIGGHTRNHPILARLDDMQARDEIANGKRDLEERLGHPIRLFAYPNGRPDKDYTPRHVDMVRDCGYELAVSTIPSAAKRGADTYQLPRFTPWDQTPVRFGLRMLRTLLS